MDKRSRQEAVTRMSGHHGTKNKTHIRANQLLSHRNQSLGHLLFVIEIAFIAIILQSPKNST